MLDKEKNKQFFDTVLHDFKNAELVLSHLPKAVSIFGSARIPKNSVYYQKAFELSSLLSDRGYSIITGGSGGIMEASNKGADDSIGLRIQLSNEQKTNLYVKTPVNFHYFFTRKSSFLKYSKALIYFPGGWGTMDELFEVLCLMQTKEMETKPIILFGVDFFSKLEDFFQVQIEEGLLSKEDLDIYYITDNLEEAITHIENNLN